jgi:uncharacterized protein
MKLARDSVGLSLRREHYHAVLETTRRIDFIEVQPENFMGRGGVSAHTLVSCAERHPVLFHGVSLNLGGLEALDDAYLEGVRELNRRYEASFFSEHLSYSSVAGEALHGLLPLPRSEEAVNHLASRIKATRDRLNCDVVVENISAYGTMPGSALSEGEFVSAVIERSSAGLLLDLNNLYVNSHNLGFPSEAELDRFPLDAVRQVHLAGHRRHQDLLLDDHGSAVSEPVWDLYRALIERIGPVPTLIEWENRVPELDVVIDELDRARAIMASAAKQAA